MTHADGAYILWGKSEQRANHQRNNYRHIVGKIQQQKIIGNVRTFGVAQFAVLFLFFPEGEQEGIFNKVTFT